MESTPAQAKIMKNLSFFVFFSESSDPKSKFHYYNHMHNCNLTKPNLSREQKIWNPQKKKTQFQKQ